MNPSTLIAKHLNEVFFGKNWTWSNMVDALDDLNWEEATTEIYGLNSIALLVFHIHYYVRVAIPVLKGKALEGTDKDSFKVPPVRSEADWHQLKKAMEDDVRTLEGLIAELPETCYEEIFAEEKYGNYYRNLHGIIEHTHYHLGQIVLLKKIIKQQSIQSKTTHL